MEAPQNHEEERRIDNPIHFKCGGCGHNEKTTFENTLYFDYQRELNKNHIRTACDRAEFWNILWIDYRDEERVEWAQQFIPMTDQDEDGNETPLMYCHDKEIDQMWAEHWDIQPLEEYETTGSQEKKIAFLAYELGRLSAEQIIDEMRDPMPRPTYPSKWI